MIRKTESKNKKFEKEKTQDTAQEMKIIIQNETC